MKRLIFKKHHTKSIWFTKNHIAGTTVIMGTIIARQTDGQYQCIITDMDKGVMLSESLCNNYPNAKIWTKKQFIELGVLFDAELRKRIG